MIKNISQVLTDSYAPAIILPRSRTKIHYSSLRHSVQFLSHLPPFCNLNAGDIVSFSMPSSVEFILTFFSITVVNAVASPMIKTWNLQETIHYLSNLKPAAVISIKGCENMEILLSSCSQLSIPLFSLELDLAFQKVQVPRVVRRIAIRPNSQLSNVKPIATILSIGIGSSLDKGELRAKSNVKDSRLHVAAILPTHSTTGTSKLVPLSHDAILTSIENVTKLFDLGPGDCTVMLLPMYHSHGLIGVMLSTFLSGGTIILESEFSYEHFWSDSSQYQASWFTATPWMHRQILKARRSSTKALQFALRFVQSTGSPLDDNLLLEMETAYNAQIVTSYTMSEATHLISTNIPNRTRKLGSVGSPVNEISCIITNEKNEKISTGIGEICISGPTVFKGYFGQDKDNSIFFEFDKSKWFKTGRLDLMKAILVGLTKEAF
jgi:oxalate---CoA ligase